MYRDSATAKALLRNYVNSGTDLTNAKYSDLHYATSVVNAKLAAID